MLRLSKEKIVNLLKIIIPMCLLILALAEIKKFISHLNVELLENEVSQLHLWMLILIVVITFAALIPMVLYDFILVRILGKRVSKVELLEKSFIANSFSNLIGFGGIAGAMLRAYFLSKLEQDKRRLLGAIAAVSLFYLTGISVLAWVTAIGFPHFPLFSDSKWLFLAVLGVCLYLPIFLAFHSYKAQKDAVSLITVKTRTALIVVSVFEWAAVFGAIYLLSIILGIRISAGELFPIYVAAACAGIISMIPGGLGSFDLVFIWGMQELNLPQEKVLVLLLLYRIGYYIIPFIFSFIFFVKISWKKWNQSWNGIPKTILQGLSHVILTILVFLSGLILLLSASIPGIISRLKIAKELVAFPVINISHQLSVAAGFLLLGLSRGIEYRVKRTYELTMLALILAALFSIFKGIDYEEAIFLIAVALLLRASKGHFYRENYCLTWGKTTFDIAVILVITSMYLFIGYVNLPTAKMGIPRTLEPYILVDYRDLFISALIGLIIASAILLVGYLISKPEKWKYLLSSNQEDEIYRHIHKYSGKGLAHLIFLHDKFIFWNQKKNVLITYQRYADKFIILGEPIGEKSELSNAIEEFQELADLHGFTLVFYEVGEAMLPYLHNHGFAFFKLGEEGIVDLIQFSLSDSEIFGNLKKQYSFEVVKPPISKELFNELRTVSTEWLQGRREKGFSLGCFDEDYLNKAPVAVVRDSNNQMLGFMSIMYVYDEKQTISVDLIRFRAELPSEIIDYAFLAVMEWAKEQGYQRFNMGMAPLANVGLSKFAFLSEKIAAQIFLHGHFIYQFQGLRKFKQKYTEIWEPKYLAYRKKSSLPITMAQITLLISRGRP